MKNINIKLWLLSFALLAFASCRKDEPTIFVPYENSVGEMTKTIATEVPNTSTHTAFNLNNVSQDTLLTTASGLRVWLVDANNLFADPTTGLPLQCSTAQNFQIEVTEALTIGDIIGYGLVTTSGGKLLENGGMVRIRITCDGKEVNLLPGEYLKIQLPVGKESDLRDNMEIFYGETQSNNNITDWVSIQEKSYRASWPTPTGEIFGYEMRCTSLGWVSSERLVADPTTNFYAHTPSEFNGQNTICWLVFPKLRSVVPMDGFTEAGKFSYSNAPVGHPVKLVAVSKIGGQWMLGNTDSEVGIEGTATISPAFSTEPAIFSFLKSL